MGEIDHYETDEQGRTAEGVITDPFKAMTWALERIAYLERQIAALKHLHDAKLPEGIERAWPK